MVKTLTLVYVTLTRIPTIMEVKKDEKDIKDLKPGLNKNPHNKKRKPKTTCTIMETTFKREHEIGTITTQTLRALHKQCQAQASMEFRNSMLLTRFKPLRGLEDSKAPKKKRTLSPEQKWKKNIT